MKIDVKIYIKKKYGKPFMGKGPIELLENIEKQGSIRKAADYMKMSYSKAHNMVVRVEKKFGKQFLRKSIGGKTGGGSVLTASAKMLINDYKRLERDIKKYACREFEEINRKYGRGRRKKT